MSLLNRNGRPVKAFVSRAVSEAISRAEAEALVQERTIEICEFYLAQVPEMVARMTLEILKRHGIEPQAPPPRTDVPAKPEEIQ